MILKRLIPSVLLAVVAAPQAHGEARELSQSEVRSLVAEGQAKGLAVILGTVGKRINGQTLDARAFDVDGLIYRISIMLADGRIANVYVDGVTGEFVLPRTSRARDVKRVATSRPSQNALSANKATESGSSKSESSNKNKGSSNSNAGSSNSGNDASVSKGNGNGNSSNSSSNGSNNGNSKNNSSSKSNNSAGANASGSNSNSSSSKKSSSPSSKSNGNNGQGNSNSGSNGNSGNNGKAKGKSK